MPPKKKNKKRKPKFIGDVDVSNMPREELENFIKELRENLKNARENRSAAQIKRDKLRTLWLVTQEETDEMRNEIQRRIKELGLAQEEGDEEMKILTQEMKYWEYMTPNKIADVNAATAAKLTQFKENFDNMEAEILQEKRNLRQQITQAEKYRVQEMTALNKHYEAECNQLSMDIEKNEEEAYANLDIDFEEIARKEKLKERLYTFSIAERKNTMMTTMRQNHEIAFDRLKTFYMDITVNALTLINHLKLSITATKRETSDRKRRGRLARSSRLLYDAPLQTLTHDLERMHRKQFIHEENIRNLAKLLEAHKIRDTCIKGFLWESDVLLMRIAELREELDMYENYHEEIVEDVHNYSEVKTELLKEKILKLHKQEERKIVEINQKLENCPPLFRENLGDIAGTVDRAVDKQMHTINDLRYKLARAQKAYDQLIESYECKCKEMGVPEDCLGIETLRKTVNAKYRLGPAGLLTENK